MTDDIGIPHGAANKDTQVSETALPDKLIPALLGHQYFQYLVERRVTELTRGYWMRWWVVVGTIFTLVTGFLTWFGYEKYTSISDLETELANKIEDLRARTTEILGDAKQVGEDVRKADELRLESRGLVTGSLGLVKSSLETLSEVEEFKRLRKELEELRSGLQGDQRSLDELKTNLNDRMQEIDGSENAREAKLNGGLEEVQALREKIEEGLYQTIEKADRLACQLEIQPRYFVLKEHNNCEDRFDDLTFCVGAIYDPSGSIRKGSRLEVKDSQGRILPFLPEGSDIRTPGDVAELEVADGTRRKLLYLAFATEKYMIMSIERLPSVECASGVGV